jgi:acetoin utilization deacetylase AcuC-like enzyme
MTILFSDPVFLKHDTGQHPERIARLLAVHAQLDRSGLVPRCSAGTFEPLPAEQIERVHSPAMVQLVRETAEEGGGQLDVDTMLSPASYNVGRSAAGACAAAVDAVLSGADRNALCLVRPPGHHATPSRSMGFCLFNNVALAARHAVSRGLARVLIVDWDVHHGNGTQDVFFADPNITFFSIHRYGHGFYPGTGASDETGTGPGLGHIFNAPMRYGISRREYHAAFRHFLERAADACKPELVLLSAGFDAHRRDPIGSLGLETEDFTTLSRDVLEVARTHSSGRLVSCLEGGYDLEALAESVQTHLEELLAQGAA